LILAAGVMIVAPCPVTQAPTVLLLLRGAGSDHPHEWAFPGGQVEPGETTAQGAARECEEECGLAVDPDELGPVLTRGVARAETTAPAAAAISPPPAGEILQPASVDVDFTTYLHQVEAQFVPALCAEHVGWCWAPLDRPPQPLHPGAAVALERPTMDELGVARAMAAGRLVSPQAYENMTMFRLRITATGASYRRGLDEFVWREPEAFLTDDFVQRCNGLPVIWEHPPNATLDSDEFASRIVGTVFLPFIEGDEVWAIAKVWDAAAARALAEQQLSTSPTVVFRDPTVNERVTLEDGSRVLIEGKPSLLDHVAICAAGVWDKGGEPAGVDRGGAADRQQEPAVHAFADATARLSLRLLRLRAAGLP
jgi:8-oxo-dGTP pyrophosphatase MutT (NUDIX family)